MLMSKEKLIVHLSTDPLDLKIKGGEQRSGFFNDFLRESYQVSSFVLPLYHIPDGRRSRWIYRFFPSIASRSSALKSFYGRALRVFYKYRNRITEAEAIIQKADMVIIEHPWMYPLFESKISPSKLVVYSSHNIEWKMIYELCNNKDSRQQTERYLKVVEHDLIARSNLVIACTDADASYFKERKAQKVVIIPNGAKDRTCNDRKSLLVASSDHAPNVVSLIQFFEAFDSSIDVNFVIVGSVCNCLNEKILNRFSDKIILFSECSDNTLNYLYSKCDSILIPVGNGGGSNIKSAEALSLNKKIFATDFAMRGFDYLGANLVTESSVELLAQKVGLYYKDSCVEESSPPKRQFLWVDKRDYYLETLQRLFDSV
jgi:hypothetical protein